MGLPTAHRRRSVNKVPCGVKARERGSFFRSAEALGDKRSGAVTLGQIARLLAAKGEMDQALKLHQERLAIFEALGDPDSIAHTLWSIAKIELSQQQVEQAFKHLAASYEALT
jgi:tetratricopeptide (TPR) repeat protein